MKKLRRKEVAWRDWQEWRTVYHWIFENNLDTQQHALSRIAAWRSRGPIPVAVDTTAQLIETKLHEALSNRNAHNIGGATRSHMELSMQYAATIIRCVNGLVDGAQKGEYAQAVSSLAHRIGIPLWIVDLRHEATHNTLPSLPSLRFAAEHLLSWLHANYWRKQDLILQEDGQGTASCLQQMLTSECDIENILKSIKLRKIDREHLKHVVIPLLVVGEAYGDKMLDSGLLFIGDWNEKLVENVNATEGKLLSEALLHEIYPMNEYIQLIINLHIVWSSLCAELLASLCIKLVISTRETDSEDDYLLAHDIECSICLMWISFLLSSRWRGYLKNNYESINALYASGADLLSTLQQRSLNSDFIEEGIHKNLVTILAACKGVQNHLKCKYQDNTTAALPSSSNDDQIMENIEQVDKSSKSWSKIQDWSPCPIGLVENYNSTELMRCLNRETHWELKDNDIETNVILQSSDNEIENQNDISETTNDNSSDTTIQSKYNQNIQDILQLRQEITEYIAHKGQTSHGKLISTHEVERIQDEIEIW